MAIQVDLSGKVVLVTGGATGIGAGVVRLFALAGAAVFFSYTGNAAGAQALQSEMQQQGHRTGCLRADLSREQDVEALVSAAERELGPVDHLVNVSGITDPHPWQEITPEIWDRTLDINLRGMFFTCQRVAKSMVARKAQEASIVTMSSVHGLVSAPNHSHYEASKRGINMLTRSLAIELGPHGIRVNCVAPGAIEVERYAHIASYNAERWGHVIPQGRVGHPDDVATVCLFLCSPLAQYVNGQVIYVDGGMTSQLTALD